MNLSNNSVEIVRRAYCPSRDSCRKPVVSGMSELPNAHLVEDRSVQGWYQVRRAPALKGGWNLIISEPRRLLQLPLFRRRELRRSTEKRSMSLRILLFSKHQLVGGQNFLANSH